MKAWKKPPLGTPLYKSVENHLRANIQSGVLSPGDLIPSEPQLAKLLGVSSGTVKKAIEALVQEQLLFRHQGKGTYVSSIDFNNSLFKFFSYGGQSGHPVRIHKETPKREIRPGTEKICQRLQVPCPTDMVYIERLGYRDDKPVLIEKCWWVAELVQGLENEEVHIPDLLYAVVVEQFDLPIVRSEESLTAEAANASIAKALDVEIGAPLVVLHRTTYSRNNVPVEFRITRGRPDSFSYRTEIR